MDHGDFLMGNINNARNICNRRTKYIRKTIWINQGISEKDLSQLNLTICKKLSIEIRTFNEIVSININCGIAVTGNEFPYMFKFAGESIIWYIYNYHVHYMRLTLKWYTIGSKIIGSLTIILAARWQKHCDMGTLSRTKKKKSLANSFCLN